MSSHQHDKLSISDFSSTFVIDARIMSIYLHVISSIISGIMKAAWATQVVTTSTHGNPMRSLSAWVNVFCVKQELFFFFFLGGVGGWLAIWNNVISSALFQTDRITETKVTYLSHLVSIWHDDILHGNVSALLALCMGNLPVTSGFPSWRASNVEFVVFFIAILNQLLSNQSRWFEMPWQSCICDCNGNKL